MKTELSLRPGDRAYFEAFEGLLRVRMLEVGPYYSKARVLEERQGYRIGKELTVPTRFVHPEAALFRYADGFMLKPYEVCCGKI